MEEEASVLSMRNQYLDVLEHTCVQYHGHNSSRPLHLIMLLAHMRQISIYCIKHMFELQHEESIPIGNLIHELMKSQTPAEFLPVAFGSNTLY